MPSIKEIPQLTITVYLEGKKNYLAATYKSSIVPPVGSKLVLYLEDDRLTTNPHHYVVVSVKDIEYEVFNIAPTCDTAALFYDDNVVSDRINLYTEPVDPEAERYLAELEAFHTDEEDKK